MHRSSLHFRHAQIALFFSICAGAILPFLAGCGAKNSAWDAARPKPLIVGMELSYPPFEMLDESGKPAGIGVDLARALATQLGRELKIENTPFDGLITALKTGRIDLIVSSMTATPERAESIDFSGPYVRTGIAILANAKSDIQGIADLDKPGRIVVTKTGTTGYLYAKNHFTQATLRVLPEEANCALEVSQGKADAFLFDQMAIFQHARKYRESTRALLEPFQREDWAIGVRKGNLELLRQVNAFLEDFRGRKQLEALGEKYLRADQEAFAKMGNPFSS